MTTILFLDFYALVTGTGIPSCLRSKSLSVQIAPGADSGLVYTGTLAGDWNDQIMHWSIKIRGLAPLTLAMPVVDSEKPVEV
jgi:hypothetical protein